MYLQGVLLSVPEAMEDLLSMKRLWIHEVLRVYYDRLVDDNDRHWLFNALRAVTRSHLLEDLDQILSHLCDSPGQRVKYLFYKYIYSSLYFYFFSLIKNIIYKLIK